MVLRDSSRLVWLEEQSAFEKTDFHESAVEDAGEDGLGSRMG